MDTGSVVFQCTNGKIKLNYEETDNTQSKQSVIDITSIQVMSDVANYAASYRVALYVYLNGQSFTLSPYDCAVTINTKNTWCTVSGIPRIYSSTYNDGKTSATMSVGIKPGYDDGKGIYPLSGDESVTIFVGSGSTSITLIPYTTYIASSVSATSPVNIGANTSITVRSASSQYVHSLSYSVDQSNWYAIQDVTADATSGRTINWNTSVLSSYFAASTRLTCYIQCITYTDSSKNKVVGSTKTSITVNASTGPSITSITATPVNTNTVIKTWNNGNIFVQGYTNLKVVVSYTLPAGATLSRNKIYVGGLLFDDRTYDSSTQPGGTITFQTTSPLTDSGTITISSTATDSRGNIGENRTTIEVYKYSAPMATSFSAIRYSSNVSTEDNENGTNLSARATISVSSVNGYNSGGVKARFKQVSDSTYQYNARAVTSSYSQINKNNSGSTVAVLTTKSYIVQFIVYDKLHTEGSNPVTYEITIPTRSVVIHSRDGGNGVALGGYNDTNGIQLWLDTFLYGKLILTDTVYKSEDPPSTGAQVGQVFFKLVD